MLGRAVAANLPKCRYAFAYGSSVFAQAGHAGGSLVDVIVAVDDAEKWHAENLQRNRAHYSGLGALSPRTIAGIQGWGANVYFNTDVSTAWPGRTVLR